MVAAADKLGMTEDEASALFHELDKDSSGTLTRKELSLFGKMATYFKMPSLSIGFSAFSTDASKDDKKATAKKKKRPSVNELFELIDVCIVVPCVQCI